MHKIITEDEKAETRYVNDRGYHDRNLPFSVRPGEHQINPIVVGGTGGSGTRAVAQFLRATGIWMGKNLNEAGDALDFENPLEVVINPILQVTRSLDYERSAVPAELRARSDRLFRAAAWRHTEGLAASGRWGFKNPRHIFVLPLLESLFPGFTFVHVLRDGRDMRSSLNQRQVRKHYEALFGVGVPDPSDAAALFWATTNLQVVAWAERKLGARYVRIRIEDLCGADREIQVRRFALALSLDQDTAVRYGPIFQPQLSFGRWRQTPCLAGQSPAIFRTALIRFGYV